MNIIERLIAEARQTPKRIVFPEGTSERILRAARTIADRSVARPILVGAPEAVRAAASAAGVPLDGLEVIDPADPGRIERFARAYVMAHAHRIGEKVARRLVAKRLMFGAMMVSLGEADAMIAGAESTTALVIQNATLGVGLGEGVSVASSFFLMVLPERAGGTERPMIFADCAVNVEPDAEALAAIAVAGARSAAALLDDEPRVALLSFSTRGSADHVLVDKVRRATALAQAALPGVKVDGELQADAAVSAAVAGRKAPASAVAGRANVLIFPDLEAGNIAYKLVQYLAGAAAYGPILQGFRRPVSDLSRGAGVDDIVGTAAILSRMA